MVVEFVGHKKLEWSTSAGKVSQTRKEVGMGGCGGWAMASFVRDHDIWHPHAPYLLPTTHVLPLSVPLSQLEVSLLPPPPLAPSVPGSPRPYQPLPSPQQRANFEPPRPATRGTTRLGHLHLPQATHALYRPRGAKKVQTFDVPFKHPHPNTNSYRLGQYLLVIHT